MKTRQFVDTVQVHVKAGSGGNGSCSFRREKFIPRGGPDGGDGGDGGSVVLQGNEDVDSLVSIFFDPRLVAEDGVSGAGRRMHGRNGRDKIVPVPLGTTVTDRDTGEFLGEVTEHGQTLLVARGGRGGRGNVHWKRADHQVPYEHTPGTPGEERDVRLELRMMADAGLVGFPSAGKSSLLRRLTAARPKVAAYPFTTLNPLIGTLLFPEEQASIRVADIPGIIEGAHLGAGLGHQFLRHIERTKALVFVIDMAGVDARAPWDDYAALLHELEMRDPALLERPRILVANKMDLPEAADLVKDFRKRTHTRPLCVSAVTGEGVEALVGRLYRTIRPGRRFLRSEHSAPGGSGEEAGRSAVVGGAADDGRVRVVKDRPLPPKKSNGGRRKKRMTPEEAARKGYTPPKPKGFRGEHPGAEDVVDAKRFSKASFLKL